MKAKKKRGVEAPPKIRAFINSVLNSPLESIEVPLSGFDWDYEKGDFYHWVDLLNHFDTFFEKYIKPRNDLRLDGDVLEVNGPPYRDGVLQILRVTRIILENCMAKYLYSSTEHLSTLLSSTDPEVVIAVLQTLAAFVKRPVQSNRRVRWHGDSGLNARLFSLSQGWGGKEQGLGLVGCATEHEFDADAHSLGSTLHFEFYGEGEMQAELENVGPGLKAIHISNLHMRPEGDLQLLKQLVDEYNVPDKLRFSLLTRIRFARAFPYTSMRRKYTCIRLLAFTVLLQSNPDHGDLAAFFLNEPEFVNELVTLLHCEDTVPEDIRILAVLALAAQSQDRPRQSNVLNVISAGGHRGILPSLMQKAIGSLRGTFSGSVAFVEALLSLVTVLVSSSSGCAALREAGLIPTLLPLLKDTDPCHLHLVTLAVHILEAFMDYSNPAGTLFRDLGGLDDTIGRLKLEVSRIEHTTSKQVQRLLTISEKGKAVAVEDGEHQQIAYSTPLETMLPYQQRLLLKALLRAIALGTYAPGNMARLHGSEESALPACLCTIFKHAKVFGGGVFSLAASVMSDLIHKDPTCFPALDKAGLPEAFLDAITNGVLPSSEAIGCIPNTLDAICLSNSGLQAVRDRNAIGCFVKIFTSKMFMRALANDTPGSLASGLDELMRHAPSLRGPGIDMCIEILKTIAAMGGIVEVQAMADMKSTDSPVPMDTDSEDRSSILTAEDLARVESSQQPSDIATENSHTNMESFLPECINNTVRLLETILQNADTSRIFIEKKGIEALLQLYTLPYLPVSFGGSSTAHNMSVTFRAFPPQHASALTQAVCGVLRDHLKLTLEILMPTCCKKISDIEPGLRTKALRSLSAVECFLSLSAVLVRSSAAMMTELSAGGAGILTEIGRVHREVLWQIALIDQAKVESERETDIGTASASSAVDPSVTGTGSRENEDDSESFPVVRYVNPMAARNGPAPRWGVDAEFLPVIQTGEGLHRRARRDHMATAEALTQIARLGRLARHASSSQVELESSVIPTENQVQETLKRKSPETLNYEMMSRLAMTARGLYVALGKALVVPTRRRDDVVPLSVAAKLVVTALVRVIGDNLSFDCYGSSLDFEASISVKCRYQGKVVDDIVAVLFDSRRRTCNTVIVNNLYAHGVIKTLLRTFEETSELLGKVLQNVSSPMETENGKMEDEKVEGKVEPHVWLLDALQSYSKLLEYLVTSSLLLTPPSAAQLLVQPVEGASIPLAKDPEVFVRALQAQVLEAVLPVWNDPKFPCCPPAFVMSIASIITHVYSGTGDVKRLKNVPAGAGVRLGGPPPDESLISTIVEMGFSRSRAEEALRRVETNSVELAMEWLFSHPEEAVQEDDELARALALSLGNSDGPRREAESAAKGKEVFMEEGPEAPPIEKMLDICMTLMQTTGALAFSITDLLVTICNREKGQDRPRVISYLVQQLKHCNWKEADPGYLSAVCHLLALSLSEDNTAREVGSQNGLVDAALDGLSHFSVTILTTGLKVEVPKWVTALLLVLDHMLQFKPKMSADSAAGTVGSNISIAGTSDQQMDQAIDVQQKKSLSPFAEIIGRPTGYMEYDQQQRAMSLVCNLLSNQLPATCVQAVLQLCARLTKTHTIAMQFLEAGGLTSLLALPRNCLFPGFDTVANAIIRHLLEDPQTLLQAMESEIRHALAVASARHNGRVSPRVFLTALASVLSREPTVFMQAVTSICQLDHVGGRMSIVLAKDKEKDRDKEKDKSQEKEKEKEKVKLGSSLPQNEGFLAEASGKAQDGLFKLVKGHKKVPHSFSQVIDQLLEVILYYPSVGKEGESLYNGMPSETAMEVDEMTPKQKGKGNVHEQARTETSQLFGLPAATAKVTFILKLMSEVLLMYTSAVTVVLRRDFESSQGKGPSQVGLDASHGGLLYHVLHRLLPYPSEKVDKVDEDWREKLSDKAAYFLMAVCIRSGEGRRRVVQEIAKALSMAAHSSSSSVKYCLPPNRKVRAFVDLVNSILSSHSSASGTHALGFSADMAKAMVDAGIIPALTQVLQVVDLDHPDAPKLVNAILKALEALTRAANCGDQVSGSEGSNSKKTSTSERPRNSAGPTRNEQLEESSGHGARIDAIQTDLLGNDNGLQMIPNDVNNRVVHMEHDMRPEGDFSGETHLEAEGERLIQGVDGAELEDATAEMTFRIDTVGGEEDDEDDEDDDDEEEMDGDDADDGDEDEEEDEEDEGDIEGDEGVPHLSPPDTDVEDHDNGLGDDFEEDMVEEEDDDEEWQEDQVIEVRWRDGLTGLNHVQVLGPGAGGNLVDIPGENFPRINVDDVFGSFRRIAGGERRRLNNYRPFSEASSMRGGAFHHPLLTRPSQSSATGSVGAGVNSLWASAGNAVRDAEAILSGGLDVAHFYMYDGPILAEHAGEGIFSERDVGGPPPPLLDFSMDPVYLMGRRSGRSDTRLSSWTDDGQPQPGAHAAALAQALEEHFVAQLHSLLPSDNIPAPETADYVRPTVVDDAERIQTDALDCMEGSEPESAPQIGGNEQQEAQGDDRLRNIVNIASSSVNVVAEVATSSLVQDSTDNSRAGTHVQIGGAVAVTCHTDLDVQMQDDRSESVPHDVEATSQDSGGSGATVGESLRSLEVEIGSVDGHDESERPIGPERMAVGDVPSSRGRETLRPLEALTSIDSHGDVEEELDGSGAAIHRADNETAEGSARLSSQQESSVPSQVDEPIQGEGNDNSRIDRESGMPSIDPTFLEALPEDLRAEVLASQQAQPFRAADHPLPPADIDPEFLAALPPDIQAEVLAQQRAQRVIQIQHVEGQPAEMDSASILATFPAELREEVLLTSSEAVLAALPPALLAEAQLLRQRVTQQYQTRNLFGGSHRIGARRNNLISVAGGHAARDHGVGGASNFGAGRLPFSEETKIKQAEGKPLVDIASLKAMLRLLRLAQPLGKGLLQRLLLNLCAHNETRAILVQLLLDMLRPDVEGIAGLYSADGAPLQRLYGCQWNVVYARSEHSDGVPPIVSRHVLEILTYLARNHALVASLLLFMEPVRYACSLDAGLVPMKPVVDSDEGKGKGKMSESVIFMDIMEGKPKSEIPLVLLLKFLSQPLFIRSSAHLEQVLGLLEVITSNAGAKPDFRTRLMPSDSIPTAPEISHPASNLNPEETPSREGEEIQNNVSASEATLEAETSRIVTTGDAGGGPMENHEPSTSGAKKNATDIVLSLPEPELRNLCSLLARDGLSDTAYTRVAEVLKKLALAAPPRRQLFIMELASAGKNLSSMAICELQCLRDTEVMLLSANSVAGAAILRVLQALSALTMVHSLSKDEGKEDDGMIEREREESMLVVRELNLSLEPLWQELSLSAGRMESRLGSMSAFSALSSGTGVTTAGTGPGTVVAPLPLGAQKVLPFVEAFFVLCEKLRSGPSPSAQQDFSSGTALALKRALSCSDVLSTAESDALLSKPENSFPLRVDEKGMTFMRFAEKHRRLLNAFVRQNPGLLEKSLSLLIKSPRLIDFDNKRAYFRSRIRQQHEQHHFTPLRICVRRAYALEDSYNQLRMRTPEELKGRLTVQFQGEEGIDAGGLTREWYQLLSRVTFDKGALLFTTVGNESTFQPNPNSVYQTEHLSYFKFIGRVVAKALFDGQLLDVYFTRSFYKHILGVKITYQDIEAIDPDYYKNLKWMLEHDITDILDLSFSIDADEEKHILYEKTEVTDYELIPGGRNIRVTEENKHEYVDLVTEHRLTTAIKPQISAFMDGFRDLISVDLIDIFNDKELELLISGLPEIDLEDLKSNTEYTGYTAASPVVQWFWEVVRTFSKEDMARLLQFITGTSKVPLEGFRALQGISGPQKFQIHKAYGVSKRLPSAHTCFNQLDLPEYPSKELLQEKLLLAIHEASEGFGFG